MYISKGGIAELFLSSAREERLFLKNRKGFIKLALSEGLDVVPLYFFGNTAVLSVAKNKFLADLSRRLQMSVNLFQGKWGLPIPRDSKIVFVRGKYIVYISLYPNDTFSSKEIIVD